MGSLLKGSVSRRGHLPIAGMEGLLGPPPQTCPPDLPLPSCCRSPELRLSREAARNPSPRRGAGTDGCSWAEVPWAMVMDGGPVGEGSGRSG